MPPADPPDTDSARATTLPPPRAVPPRTLPARAARRGPAAPDPLLPGPVPPRHLPPGGRAAPATATGAPPAPGGLTVPAYTESVLVPRFIATAATTGRREAEWLVRAAGLPGALNDPETERTPSAATYRLWGAVLARTGRADAGLLAAAGYRRGRLDVFDYLLSTAPTVGEGLARASAHLHLVSSNSVLVTEECGDEISLSYGVHRGDEELRGVVAEFALGVLAAQVRHATGGAVAPRRALFAHRAPRGRAGRGRLVSHATAFGTAALEFGCGHDALTFTRGDLERPLDTADPALALIMARTAAAIRPPRPSADQAVPGLREAIVAQLADGRPSLAEAARRLAVSTRTLQRRLGESGTTWRAELDAVRRERSAGLSNAGAGTAQRAARLGFSESRSLRRAMNRWDAQERRAPARAGAPDHEREAEAS